MSNNLSAETTLKGSSIIGALKKAQVRTVVALPDIVTCEHVLWPISKDKSFRLVQVCKEDEGIGICAGLSYCDHRAILLIQHTGFLDSINAIRAVAVEYHLPIVMLVGLQGMELDRLPARSDSIGISSLEPICDALQLKHKVLAQESDVESLADGIADAYQKSLPVVYFIVRSPE